MMIKNFQSRKFHKAYDDLCAHICASKVKKPSTFVKIINVCADALESNRRLFIESPAKTVVWSPDGTRLAIYLAEFGEIWVASLDPNASTIDSLCPALGREEVIKHRLQKYNRVIKIHPSDPSNYLKRALIFVAQQDFASAEADLSQFEWHLNPNNGELLRQMCWWGYLNRRNNLYPEAEFLLLKATEIADHVFSRTRHALSLSYYDPRQQLIQLYETWDKPEKAKEWRAKLPQIEAVEE